METSPAVCRGSEWRTQTTHVSLTVSVCTVKPLLLQTMCVEVFSEVGLQHYFHYRLGLSACIRHADRRGAL